MPAKRNAFVYGNALENFQAVTTVGHARNRPGHTATRFRFVISSTELWFFNCKINCFAENNKDNVNYENALR